MVRLPEQDYYRVLTLQDLEMRFLEPVDRA